MKATVQRWHGSTEPQTIVTAARCRLSPDFQTGCYTTTNFETGRGLASCRAYARTDFKRFDTAVDLNAHRACTSTVFTPWRTQPSLSWSRRWRARTFPFLHRLAPQMSVFVYVFAAVLYSLNSPHVKCANLKQSRERATWRYPSYLTDLGAYKIHPC